MTNEIEADCLEQIARVPRLHLILLDWESKYRESKSRIDRKEALSENVKSEIYHLVGFFSAFQGLVLTTVSQASALTCHNWWGPFALSLLCSIATLLGVCHKFYNLFEWKRAAEKETQHAKVLKTQIHLLKKYGNRFNFAEHAPDVNDQEEKEKRKKRKSFLNFVVSSRYFILALLVILTMLLFSSIILISTVRILCYP